MKSCRTADRHQVSVVLYQLPLSFCSRAGFTWRDNKVRELATVCLPWQHWTKKKP